jgi:hypothetical protein
MARETDFKNIKKHFTEKNSTTAGSTNFLTLSTMGMNGSIC